MLEEDGTYLLGEEVSQTFFNERSARKQTSCNIKRLRASARRRHKWPEVPLAKKQTPPNSFKGGHPLPCHLVNLKLYDLIGIEAIRLRQIQKLTCQGGKRATYMSLHVENN
ncbi:hypothetical protein HanRHA438_Chr13g0625211 [Helianthus annuus]|nr:hypothetical protein HanRHA438_Chr13g0625211 [Helianthus annuus]